MTSDGCLFSRQGAQGRVEIPVTEAARAVIEALRHKPLCLFRRERLG